MWNWLQELLGLKQRPMLDPTWEPTPTATPTIDPFTQKGWVATGPNKYAWPTPTPTPSPAQLALSLQQRPSFGIGTEPAHVEPSLFDTLMALRASGEERRNIAELSGQESSYGYARPHIAEAEESFGPVHINLKAGRINPATGRPFTREEAENIETAIQYALSEYRRTGGLGAWNPGAYPFYQEEIPKRAKTKKFYRGK